MKLASFSTDDGTPRIGVVTDDGCLDLARAQHTYQSSVRDSMSGEMSRQEWDWTSRLGSFIAGGKINFETVKRLVAFAMRQPASDYLVPLNRVRLHAPIVEPFMLGEMETNCAAQFKQRGLQRRSYPAMVIIPDNVINDPGVPVLLPSWVGRVGISAQIAFVCGERVEDMTEAKAEQAIFGYMLSLCITATGLVDQLRNPNERDISVNEDYGRWFDGFRPMGPYLVTREEINPLVPRALELYVGDQRLTTNTTALLHKPAHILAVLSEHIPFYPGDVVGLGAMGEDLFLPPGPAGQEIPVTVTAKGLGTLVTTLKRTC